ncbi:gem-associated protein 4 isoform X2 [Protopterus annectens]|nr:gem-associated protein 4 isoform X2 [Protopterus annectens]XP_043910229.1 gem-associated protein 4 isoform X2 [Protopterus annectens]
MNFGPWISCERMAVLHGGFLLAEKQYHPKTLAALNKSEWGTIGQHVIRAFEESCKIISDPGEKTQWKKKVIAFIWAKVLSFKPDTSGNDVDHKWKSDIFFSVHTMIPNVNYVTLLELVKSLQASELFVQLLMALPPERSVSELKTFADHALNEVSLTDIDFFLDLWQEIMKYKKEQQDEIDSVFAAEACRFLSDVGDEFSQSPKRFKPNNESGVLDSPGICIPGILFDCLQMMVSSIVSLKFKCCALANLAQMLFTTMLSETDYYLPIDLYLQKLAIVISVWNASSEQQSDEKCSVAKVKEAEKVVRSAHTASNYKLSNTTRIFGLQVFSELLHSWSLELKEATDLTAEYTYQRYRMIDCFVCFNKILSSYRSFPDLSEADKECAADVCQTITDFLENLSFPVLEGKAILFAVAVIIIDERMDRYKEVCSVFASASSWASSTEEWISCIERNKVIFTEQNLVLKLIAAVMSEACLGSSNDKLKRIMAVTLDCFSELSVVDQNSILVHIISAYGPKGLCTRTGIPEDFQKELNLSFNCITQSEGDLTITKAASSVARVLLLHPEATLQKACHLAVVNLGAQKLLAEILKNLLAPSAKECSSSVTLGSLLIGCLKEAAWEKLTSDIEVTQFLDFLSSLMQPYESSCPLLCPNDVVKHFVLPHLMENYSNLELSLQILKRALHQDSGKQLTEQWIINTSPFPLVFSLCCLLDGFIKCWQEGSGEVHPPSIETRDLLIYVLEQICSLAEQVAAAFPETRSRSLLWLHRKTENLDWTVRLRLRSIYCGYFKNEVPSTLFEVCKLSDYEWSPLNISEYGQGTGLLAWMECCCSSADVMEEMISSLNVDQKNPDEINMFSKGFLIALVQVMPWCSQNEWKRLAYVVKKLLQKEYLHVPYTLEYVTVMPLLNLRPFACELQFSVLLLRAFQFLCSKSCSDWLPVQGWTYVAKLYSNSISDVLESVKSKCTLQETNEDQNANLAQECIFVFIQLFCHVLHITVMMPEGTTEPLYVLALKVLSQYEAQCMMDNSAIQALTRANEKYFLQSIAEHMKNEEQRTTLLQKISKF